MSAHLPTDRTFYCDWRGRCPLILVTVVVQLFWWKWEGGIENEQEERERSGKQKKERGRVMWNATLDGMTSLELHAPISNNYLASGNDKNRLLPFKWKEIQTRATDSCSPRGTACCKVWRTLPCLPDCRHVEAIRYPSVQSRCQSEFAWLLSESHVSRPRWELLTVPSTSTAGRFAFGLDRVFARPPSTPLYPPDGLREADKKGNGLRSKEKKKKIGSVSSNSWARLGESQPVFQACCVLTHHCQDCDLWFLGLHPSC